ncbi:hypothetical protein ONS96_013398 [Cadophora gregata f. sp. sojae]|nr:hypothetical protein ONS96_013398 [Cadophora gregata f. sp. sojae]
MAFTIQQPTRSEMQAMRLQKRNLIKLAADSARKIEDVKVSIAKNETSIQERATDLSQQKEQREKIKTEINELKLLIRSKEEGAIVGNELMALDQLVAGMGTVVVGEEEDPNGGEPLQTFSPGPDNIVIAKLQARLDALNGNDGLQYLANLSEVYTMIRRMVAPMEDEEVNLTDSTNFALYPNPLGDDDDDGISRQSVVKKVQK